MPFEGADLSFGEGGKHSEAMPRRCPLIQFTGGEKSARRIEPQVCGGLQNPRRRAHPGDGQILRRAEGNDCTSSFLAMTLLVSAFSSLC